MTFPVLDVQAVTLQEALTSTQYAVSSCDINHDGRPDYLVKGATKMIVIPLDDDLDIPIVIPPAGPAFLIQSVAGADFSVVQNPDKTVQADACWTPAAYSAKPGDGTTAPAGTLYLSPIAGDGPSFLIGVQAGTSNLQLAGIKRPAVVTDPSTASAPLGSIPVPAKSQTRTTTYEYETASGLLSKQVIEPDNAQLRVEVSLAYDSWGNVATSAISSPAGGSAAVVPRIAKSQYGVKSNGFNPLRAASNAASEKYGDLAYDFLALISNVVALATKVPLVLGTADGLNRAKSIFSVTVTQWGNAKYIPGIGLYSPPGSMAAKKVNDDVKNLGQ